MKRIRRIIALMLVLCFFGSMLSGCGKKEEDSAKKRDKNTATATPTVTAKPTDAPTETPTPIPTEIPDNKPTPAFGKPEYTEEQKKFNAFLDEVLVEFSKGSGFSIHFSFENPEQFGIERVLDCGDVTTDIPRYIEICTAFKARLSEFDYNKLTEGQKVNYDRMMYEFNLGIAYKNLNVHTYCGIYSNNNNIISDLSTLLTEYPLITERDVMDYLTVMESIPAFLDAVYAEAYTEYTTNKCVLTESMIDTTIENIEGIVVTEANPIKEAFAANIKEAKLSEDKEASYIAALDKVLTDVVFPALIQMGDNVAGMYDLATDKPYGMSALSGGKEYYEYMIQGSLGVEMSADELFKYLDGKFKDEYSALVRLATFHSGALAEYPYADYKVEDAKANLDSLKEFIKKDYPAIPETQYTVSELPDALRVDGVLAYFLTPQYDNPGRKVIRFNPDGISKDEYGDKDCVGFFSTLAHEGYPGHLYQNAYFVNCEGFHAINNLLGYTGYTEGWAVVAGQAAYNYIVPNEYVAQLYALDYNLSMDMASIAAIGVNYYGWSVDDLADYLADYNFGDYAEMFYEDVIVDPVVYLPYTIGRYLMLDTIELLKAKGYTDMEAKTAILNVGPASFEVLWKHLGVTFNAK